MAKSQRHNDVLSEIPCTLECVDFCLIFAPFGHYKDDQIGVMVLAQRRVPVLPGDTPDTLAVRVLEEEHILYAETLQKIACGQIRLQDFGSRVGC